MFYVYVLEDVCDESNHYIGMTGNLRNRLESHNSNDNNGYTRGVEWKLLYYEAYETRSLAYKREQSLKRNGRARQLLYKRLKG